MDTNNRNNLPQSACTTIHHRDNNKTKHPIHIIFGDRETMAYQVWDATTSSSNNQMNASTTAESNPHTASHAPPIAAASTPNNGSSTGEKNFGGFNIYQERTTDGRTLDKPMEVAVFKKVVKFMKKGKEEKHAFAGKRKALGASNGNKLLQEKAKNKKELVKVQGRLNDMC